jgi:hypothetical protein
MKLQLKRSRNLFGTLRYEHAELVQRKNDYDEEERRLQLREVELRQVIDERKCISEERNRLDDLQAALYDVFNDVSLSFLWPNE